MEWNNLLYNDVRK